MAHVQIFLSTVTAEFRGYRDVLRRDLDRPNVTVKVQEDFIATGTETLDKLDEYIRHCDVVIHLVGDMTGAWAKPTAVTAIRHCYPDLAERFPVLRPFLEPDAPPLSYTQWETWLALYHRKILIVAAPVDDAPRYVNYKLVEDQCIAQQAHLERLKSVGRYPEIHFANADRLAVDLLKSKLLDILLAAGVVIKPVHLPYRSIGDLFKGREAMLDSLHQSFGAIPESAGTPAIVQVLSGLGGIGKTRLALEYAWKRASQYTQSLFITADSLESLQRNLAALCGPSILNLPEQSERDQEKQRNAVVTWLRQHPGWLLILDNIDSEEGATAAEALLPQLAGGHVLLTSRLANWSSNISALPLDVLSLEAAIDFLLARTASKRRSQPDDIATAEILVKEFGYLALALEQASAYIAKHRLSFTGYLEKWQSQRDKVLDWFDPRLMQYPKSMAITWQTSFERLGESARLLLRRLCWLAPEPIPESLLGVAGPDTVQADPFLALTELESYSLVTRAADLPVFSVHPMVQEVTRRSQCEDSIYTTLLEALWWLDIAFVGDPQDVRTWSFLMPLAPHVRTVISKVEDIGLLGPTARLLNNLTLLYYSQGQYAQAEPLYQRSLLICEKAFGPDHPNVATILNNLAELYRTQGQYAQAESLYQRSLVIREKTLGTEHCDVAQSLNNLALLYYSQGQYEQAEPLCHRSLRIYERALGPNHPNAATSLVNLALLYYSQGQYTHAEPLYQRSLAIYEDALGPHHPNVALSLNNLAELHRTQGQYAQAEPLYERALVIREKALGPDHCDVAQSLNNLALLYYSRGQYAQAEPLYQRALAIYDEALGQDHPNVAQILNNLATLYYSREQYAQVEPLYQRALAIREKALGPVHPNVAQSLNNLATLYYSREQYAQVEPLYQRALAISEKALGPVHPDVAQTLNNLAELYRTQGRYAQAEPLYQRALVIYEEALDPSHPNVPTSMSNLALLYYSQGQYAQAEPLYLRALAIREKLLGPSHPDVAVSLENIATLYKESGREEEAAGLDERAAAIRARKR